MQDFIVAIPARYASTRLPGKPLLDIGGLPMVIRVAERARLSGASQVVILTDDERICAACSDAGFASVMTRADHPSGTDRIAEFCAAQALADDAIVVNVQGDEPLLNPELIRQVATQLAECDAAMSTACHPIHTAADMFNPNIVKVVLDKNGYALYFSRAPIPWDRDTFAVQRDTLPAHVPVYRHLGLYAYRAGFLRNYSTLPLSPLEQVESLEQLRVLWHGYRITVSVTQEHAAPGVDTAADLQQVRQMFDLGANNR